jgi:hypothetical protein
MNRSYRYPRTAWLTLAVAALAAVSIAVARNTAAQNSPDPAPLTLRLGDLPRGWKIGNDSGCNPLGTEDAPPEVRDLVRRHAPFACRRDFIRLWGGARIFFVESDAFTFDAEQGAHDAFAIAGALLRYATALSGVAAPTPAPAPVGLGDEAVAFTTTRAYLPGPQPSAAFAVVWRSGGVVASVVAGSRWEADAAAAAVAYARKQQPRIAAPTPLSPADFDDLLVPIDNPRLGIPVWWLGRAYDPAGPLPPLTLTRTGGPFGRGESPGNIAELGYTGAWVMIWRPAAWKQFLATRLGRKGWDSPCAHSRTIHVRSGRAVIWSGYWITPRIRPCPKTAPDMHFAHVYGRNLVITVNISICTLCRPTPSSRNLYATTAGLEAVVRGLHLRR